MLTLGLSTLTSLTGLLTAGITDEFKKLLQPQVLVSTAIVCALQLALIVPDRQLAQLAALGTTWQIALGSLVFFVTAYLVGSFSGFFLDVVSGKAFARSPIVGRLALRYQRWRFERMRRLLHREERADRERATFALAFDFPREVDHLAPTGLGNVLMGTWSYVHEQYGAGVDALWPVMNIVLDQAKEDSLRGRLRASQEALNFLAGISVLLLLTAMEVTAARAVLDGCREWQKLLIADATLLACSLVTYFAAVQKARDWGRDVRLAFHLYLDAAAAQLGLVAIPRDKIADRKERWRRVAEWMTLGAVDLRNPDAPKGGYRQPEERPSWYAAAEASITLRSPPGTTAAATSRASTATGLGTARAAHGVYYDYVITITNAEEREVRGAFLGVTDARLDADIAAPAGRVYGPGDSSDGVAIASRRAADGALVWPLRLLWSRAAWQLEYSAGSDHLIISVSPPSAKVIAVERPDEGESLDVLIDIGPDGGDLEISVEAKRGKVLGDPVTPRLVGGDRRSLPPVAADARGSEAARTWRVIGVPGGHQVQFDVPYRDQE
jgi:hypothetical protein